MAERDGEILGIAGLHYTPEGVEIFSDIEDELRAHPFFLYRTAKKVVKMADGLPAFSVQGEYETAPKFLNRLGFVKAGPIWRYTWLS